MQRLDVRAFALGINPIPEKSHTQALQKQKSLDLGLLKSPEVKEVFTRLGTSEIATDAQPPSIGDSYVMLKPRQEWPSPEKSKQGVTDEVGRVIDSYIANNIELSPPIQMRIKHLLSTVKRTVSPKI